jgi:hypothetical protein
MTTGTGTTHWNFQVPSGLPGGLDARFTAADPFNNLAGSYRND